MIPQKILQQFRDGFDNEPSQIRAIEKYLLDETTKSLMRKHSLTVLNLLICDYPVTLEPTAGHIRALWNRRLGFKGFLGDESANLNAMQEQINKMFGGLTIQRT